MLDTIKQSSKSSHSLGNFLGFSELPDWYLTSRYRYVDSRWIHNDFGHRIHYRDVGEGPVVLLLHGELSSLHVWDEWVDGMSEDFRVIAVDLPGSGLTGATHCVYDIKKTCPKNLSQEYIEHTLEYFIQDMQIRQFSLVGHGYGAYLAARYALNHSNKMEKLILVSPLGFPQEEPESLSWLKDNRLFTRFVQPAPLIANVYDDFYADSAEHNFALKRQTDLAQSQGAYRSNIIMLEEISRVMAEGDHDTFNEIDTPTLIMWGKQDKWGDPKHADLWDETIENSTLVTYPALGRMLSEEATDITTADMIAFLLDEPLPTIEGLGTEGSFTIDEAAGQFDSATLFEALPADSLESDSESDSETETDSDIQLY